MSEEIDLNVNNLSTTEEAFEVFQSNSICIEDERLTLPIRECPQPTAVGGASEFSDMSIENDLVSSTNIEDQSQLNYCNLEVGCEVNITEEPDGANCTLELENEASSDPNYSLEVDCLQERGSEVLKDVNNDINMDIGETVEMVAVSSSEVLHPKDVSGETVEMVAVSSSEVLHPKDVSPSKKGRGRPKGRGKSKGRGRGRGKRPVRTKKTLSDNTSLTNSDFDVPGDSSLNLSSQSVSDSTLESTNNNINLHLSQSETNGSLTSLTQSVDTTEEIPVVRRRGRKTKATSDNESLPCSDTSASPKVPRKRGRPRKNSNLNVVLEEPLPMNGDVSINSTNSSEIKNLSEMVENLNKIEDNLSKLGDNLSKIEKLEDDDDDDDISLSKLKTTIDCDNKALEINDPILKELQEIPSSPLPELGINIGNGCSVAPSKPISPVKEIKDNDDTKATATENMIVEDVPENKSFDAHDSLLVEDVSKRPKRSNTRKTLKYKNDDDSDEDPFANVELSDDDEPRRGKKSGRYHSDEEYIPGRKGRSSSIDSSDSAVGDTLKELKMQTKKRGRKKKDVDCEMLNLSPTEVSNMDSVEDKQKPWRFTPDDTIQDLCDDNDIGITQTTTVSDETKPKPSLNSWGTTNEFENFLAKKIQGTNLKIKKVSSSNSSPSVVAPLEIPVIDLKEAKKKVDCSAQTNKVHMSSTSSQTTGPEGLSMKTNVPLNDKQSENACTFLKSIVKTTSELGVLMTQKSDDFIQKKINTTNVVDTFKMDYCVKKSFLLLKLAKHNLMQMEEDLSNQYEKFLKENELLSYREQEKKIEPNQKQPESDSDCEIIEEPIVAPKTGAVKKESKPKFNPKTVFLNKELSIKIAKKPSEDIKSNKNINIKGRHTVWINDSVMVKKVKGSQSFLAQDSRNKKPPDNKITNKMVSDFFTQYNRQRALSLCAPFISTEWFTWLPHKCIHCKYFSVEPDKLTSGNISRTDEIFTNNENNAAVSASGNGLSEKRHCEVSKLKNPSTLLSICLRNLQENFYVVKSSDANVSTAPEYTSKNSMVLSYQPKTLFASCLEHLTRNEQTINNQIDPINATSVTISPQTLPSLKTLCHLRINELCFVNKTFVDKDYSVVNESVELNKVAVSKYDDTESYGKSYAHCDDNAGKEVQTLLTLCTQVIQHSIKIVFSNNQTDSVIAETSIALPSCHAHCDNNAGKEVQTLLTLCTQVIQHSIKIVFSNNQTDSVIAETSIAFPSCPNSLKHIAFDYVSSLLNDFYPKPNIDFTQIVTQSNTPPKVRKLADICFDLVSRFYEADDSNDERAETIPIELTINAVNTLSEEAFFNIEETSANDNDNSDYYDNDDDPFYEEQSVEPNYNEEGNGGHNESWISQVQLKELKSCFVSDKSEHSSKPVPDTDNHENDNIVSENYPLIAQIKSEPGLEESPTACESYVPIIKTEPEPYIDQMTIIPESVVTKKECIDNVNPLPVGREPILRQNSASFDEENFEAFVRSNKMIRAISNDENDTEETFSQSALRVRRQHEPDSDNENDTSMSLLVPQTFEPLTVESAKGSLLENSSSDSENVGKKINKRKPIVKRKTKKPEPPKQNKEMPPQEIKELQPKENKEVQSKDKPIPVNEVAMLTRRMRERIRQEEKKGESSESDSENGPPISRQEKETKKETKRSRAAAKINKPDDDIQCNNVDSTEQITDGTAKKPILNCESNAKEDNKFTGFTAVDQNEISTYHKYVKFVYDQIIPKVNDDAKTENPKEKLDNDKTCENVEGSEEIINPEEPIELLECTPTMPMFDEENVKTKPKSNSAETKSPGKKKAAKESQLDSTSLIFNAKDELKGKDVKTELFTERNGWQCYPIQSTDTKLYEQVIIPLEKLPESFVRTYFEYQDISVKSKDDEEIDRLTNLQSLNRISSIKKPRIRKDKVVGEDNENSIYNDPEQPHGSTNADDYNELSASDDEGANYDDDYNTPGPDTSDNNIAKNSLMNDDDDDDVPLSLRKIKKEMDGDATYKKKRPGPKSKTVEIKQEHPESLMLTADKMMNKELTLLHAPVVLDNENIKTPTKGRVTRNKPRSGTKNYFGKGDRTKSDDSSSEEEKQWVNTKEKLLKRMGKKQESAMEDDAKRAKLVTEFIERRNDKPLILNHKPRGRSRRSRKKLLERQKQMRVLSYELLGDVGPHIGKGNSGAYFKGRRNIRKVIDKKSLARSTVLANMEEFERKRRLNVKQKKLEELLGCEEGVNVIVTNDEVCLEYNFEVGQPAVTVHPFFTKVMKAHQYEGVKFMWDACFESIDVVQSGHPGGGCILAHCMGLGKTLQVLALLHTVLTHPRVGMHRVLVCCPLSTVLNWVDEIHKWIGPVTDEIKVFELSKLKKTYERAYQLEDWYNGGGIFIIGYELFRSLTTLDAELDDVRQTIIDKIRTALLDPGPDIIVCDEGHLLKNDCSVLAVAMSRVATRRRIVLTGTPMQNNLREYYCMVNFVKPNLLGTYSEYSNRFENPIMNGQHRDSQVEDIKLMKARTHILHKVLEGCLQRQEASVLYPYLPKKHEYTVFISLTQCQCDLYKHYLSVYANKNKQSILKDFHTLQKIWSHPQVLHNFNMKSRDEKNKVKAEKLEDDLARDDLTASEDIKPSKTEVWWLQYLEGGDMLERLESSNKFITVFRILEESVALDDKVLIFSTSLITMDSLEYFLKKINNWSLGQEYYRLDGSVPPEVRQKWCREFNAEHNYKTKLFLISTRAGSLGLNMTAANRVIILDTSWNPAHDIQSIFRVYRFGQKKDCYIYRLVALGTMEQKIYERAVTKQAVSCRVVDEQQIDRHYNMAELTELYRFDSAGAGVAGGVAVGVHDVVLLRVARDAALHAVHEHDSLLRGSEPALPEHERAAAWHQFQQETQTNQLQADKVPKKEKKIAKKSIPQSILPEVKPEPGTEGIIAVPVEPKTKRGKKVINCRIPIHSSPQPSTSSQLDDLYMDKAQELDMVSKISQILVTHDFNSKRTARDLSKLIARVQQAVASGDLSQLPPGDEAATSIAQILLRKQPVASIAPPMPALTDIRNPVLEKEPTRTKRKQPEPEDQSFSDTNAETITGDLNVKTRRRAAVSAQKKFDTIADDIVIDLNDDDWQNNEDFAVKPTRNPEPATPKYKPGPKSKKKMVKSAQNPPETTPVAIPIARAPSPQQLVESIPQSINLEESILLSDDEIVPEVRPAPTIKQEPGDKKSGEEKYPLHPSLLTNQNFVKIVAHTYLAGNPMLDEDAATLAARYSTSKALREMEATGRSIDSGPIYDIAVKVLGIDILKKLHNSDATANSSLNKSEQKKLSDTEKMLSKASPELKPQGRLKAKVTSDLMPVAKKPKIPNLGKVKMTPVTPVIQAPVVVPVGLIKRATPVGSHSGATAEESILPDDDDVHVVAAPPPRAPPAPRRATRSLLLNNADGASTQDDHLLTNIKVPIAPAPAETPVIRVMGNRMLAVGPDAPPPRALPAPATICLDSDDDEPAPAPAPAPAPVPVSLTAAAGARRDVPVPPEAAPAPRSRPAPAAIASETKPPPRPAPDPKPPATAVCKPGDIIRITKTGQVEVLNKVDAVPELFASGGRPRAGPASKTAAGPASKTAAGPAPRPPEPKVPAKQAERPPRVSSDGASGSRSLSPADPLSILRDVVQIPADRYQNVTSFNAPRAGPSKPPPDPPKPAAPPNLSESANSLFDRLNTFKQKSKKSASSDKRDPVPAKSKKITSVCVDSVDLTDIVLAPPPLFKSDKKVKNSNFTSNISMKLGKRVEPVSTVVGTSKNIILSGSGKTNKVTVGSAPTSSSKGSAVRVTNMETLAPAAVKPRDKKRLAIKLEPGTPKRKKTELMTLKDFNLDDIDDIIELE